MKYIIWCKFIILLFLGCQQEMPRTYLIDELDLVPEGIDFSKKHNSFYLSSVAKSKIIKIDKYSGVQEDFIVEKEYDYSPGVGVYVDEAQDQLYAIGGYYSLDETLTTLFKFDLTSQELINKYEISDTGSHFLNDMVIDKKGNIYLTNTKDSSIYYLEQGADSLALFFKSTDIQYPNGIALSEDNTKLYVASFQKGVRVLDIEKRIILNDIDSSGVSGGIDGLEYYKGALYAIQNGVQENTHNLRKLLLNEQEDEIVGVEVIDSRNADLYVPLTFCIHDGKAIVIANSNLQHLDQVEFTFAFADSIKNTQLLVYDLE